MPTLTTQKNEIPIGCHRCRHIWNYTGKNEYVASCPSCKTAVMIRKHRLSSTEARKIKEVATD
jgi:hypothetical protein